MVIRHLEVGPPSVFETECYSLLMFILLVIKLFLLIYFIVLSLFSLFVLYRIFKSQISSFECGFTGVGAVMKLRLNFFSILIVFIIFDLEIVLLIGIVTKDFVRTWGLFLVWLFILLGFYFEWIAGKLSWLV